MTADRKRNPADIQAAFDDLFDSFTDEEQLEQEGRLIGFTFLSEVERVMDERGMNRKDLAEKMNTSASFITQLFTGDKPLSDKHKAMLQRALGIRFTIKAMDEAAYQQEPEFIFPEVKDKDGWWTFHKFTPDYDVRTKERPDYYENAAA